MKETKSIGYNLLMMIATLLIVLPLSHLYTSDYFSLFYLILAGVLFLFWGFNAHKSKKWHEMNLEERKIFLVGVVIIFLVCVSSLISFFLMQ